LFRSQGGQVTGHANLLRGRRPDNGAGHPPLGGAENGKFVVQRSAESFSLGGLDHVPGTETNLQAVDHRARLPWEIVGKRNPHETGQRHGRRRRACRAAHVTPCSAANSRSASATACACATRS
ncbi:hypothetical protein RZS08_30585, partial [Arthrospira platensis SPKY1]|nr:hypothetical protein [Arthrospira platensis SPKY1]